MTGFGRGTARVNGVHVEVEVRSVNSRFLEIAPRLPRRFEQFEEQIREAVQQRFRRGRITVYVNLENEAGLLTRPVLNLPLVEAYLKLADEIEKIDEHRGSIATSDLLQLPDIILFEPDETQLERVGNAVREALDEALDNVEQMRRREGELLAEGLSQGVREVSEIVKRLGQLEQRQLPAIRQRLEQKLAELTVPSADPGRLEQELVFWADRVDLKEELDRLEAHLNHFRELLEADDQVGKRLNFLLQEMNREANTLGSKTVLTEISHEVVNLKNLLEQLREQVQNIE